VVYAIAPRLDYLPVFTPGSQNVYYLQSSTEGDIGRSYLIERGKKRHHRLQAAKDQTAVTISQVAELSGRVKLSSSVSRLSLLSGKRPQSHEHSDTHGMCAVDGFQTICDAVGCNLCSNG
jgi:hypothetical protein